jgi:hypothetical protein
MTRAPLDIAKLRAVAEAATPGEWVWVGAKLETRDATILVDGTFQELDEWSEAADTAHIAAFNPSVALELLAELERARASLSVAVEALKFYAQTTVPDITSEFAKSAADWNHPVVTWEPLTDLGERARAALARIEGRADE